MITSEDHARPGKLETGAAARFLTLLWPTVARASDHRLTRRFKIWMQLDRDVSELASMSDRELRDLGINRMDIAAIRAGTCKRESEEIATLDRLDIGKSFQVPTCQRAMPMDSGIDVIGDQAMPNFDANCLRELRDVQEVVIRTEKHRKSAVVIWVVVADDKVFVRSWLGTRGRWYRDIAAGGPATLEFAGHRIAVQAIPANDPTAIAQVSREFLRKYKSSSHAEEMVRSETLPTTLRLEPR